MRGRFLCFMVVIIAVGCSDQPLTDELSFGPSVSSAAPSGPSVDVARGSRVSANSAPSGLSTTLLQNGDLAVGGNLAVGGTVEAQHTGFKFPDGTVQRTAAVPRGSCSQPASPVSAEPGTPRPYVTAVGWSNVGLEPFVGEIALFPFDFAPRGWAFAEGQLLAVNSNDALFSLLGTKYGGDGRTTFGLPDMRGLEPVCGMHWNIALVGIYPSRN